MSPPLAALLLAAFVRPAGAQLYDAARPGLIPRGVPVLDESGRSFDLASELSGPRPTLLLPLFTSCAASCPIMVESLRKAVGKAPEAAFRVVLFSFDASDTDDALREFRKDMKLPPDWRLVRAATAGGAREFLDPFGYAVMRRGSGFVHPNELFVLSPKGRWSATFAGEAFPESDLRRAFLGAQVADRPAPAILRSASQPAAWAVGAAAGLVLASIGAVLLAPRRRN